MNLKSNLRSNDNLIQDKIFELNYVNKQLNKEIEKYETNKIKYPIQYMKNKNDIDNKYLKNIKKINKRIYELSAFLNHTLYY